ncbi:RdgB/HAM1 family non-canonical purine NTP pyrophosphatase [Candidatus Avelusimicrobium facis]|uniref:RdgB/HAM1 family non-canonical purine NTP pyrophosphatase n=1 Tax=Candidatus Avelusimicrobium facis TaxID=3416203 RepID=UPI0015B726E3
MKILVATGNQHKFKEITEILPRRTKTGEDIEYLSLADIGGLKLPPENGATLEENAEVKAVYAAKESGLPAVSDDTGMEVEFLDGRPGVHTARYAGENADADDNNRKLLNELEGLFLGKRAARFRTVACLATPQGKVVHFEGSLDGFIGFGYRGENGFGYDPLFIVAGTNKTLAEMTDAEKNTVSHRGQAFKKLAEHLTVLGK